MVSEVRSKQPELELRVNTGKMVVDALFFVTGVVKERVGGLWC